MSSALPPVQRWRARYLIFSDEDTELFDAALKTAFPAIRFFDGSYRDAHLRNPKDAAAKGPSICYQDTLTRRGSIINPISEAWLEPEGWQPIWSFPDSRGYRTLVNEPKLGFVWEPSATRPGSWFDLKGRYTLREGRITAKYAVGDREQIAFINKVWRLVAKLSTNKIPWCYHDLASDLVLGPFVPSAIWIGHGALRWVRQDPRHCLFRRHRPCDSIDREPDGTERPR